MSSLMRAARLAGFVSVVVPVVLAAQGTVRVHSFNGGVEYYTGSTTVGFHKDGDPEEHFLSDAAHPGTLDLEPGKHYRIVLVVAGDLTGEKCTLTTPGDQGGFNAPSNHDTLDLHVDVEFKYCGYRASPQYADEDTAAHGTMHFHADKSWVSGFTNAGAPFLSPGGNIDFTCALDDADDCDRGSDGDKALAYTAHVIVTYTPASSKIRVSGLNPFTGENFTGAPGAVISLIGEATKELDFEHVYFSTVHTADGSIALTSSSVHDTVVTGSFHLHNDGPDSTVFILYVQGSTVVRAGAGHVAKVEVTTPLGTCEQIEEQPCAGVSMKAGTALDISVKTTTARLGDGSSAAVGANSCGTITIYSNADDSHMSDNTVACVSGTSTPVTVAVTTGGNPPASQTVATGSTNVPVLQFAMAPSAPVTLDDITISASGSGNDQVDITAVKLFVDANGNGIVDGSEASIASGTFGANNGTVTLAVTPTYTVSAPTAFLVTFDFNTTLASRYGGALVLAGLLPVALVPRRRRRGVAGALMLVAGLGIASLGLGACGSDSTGPNPPPGGNATFTATLNGMTAGGSAVSGVSVHGATITIAK